MPDRDRVLVRRAADGALVYLNGSNGNHLSGTVDVRSTLGQGTIFIVQTALLAAGEYPLLAAFGPH